MISMRNIVLVGFMGTGKSTVGRQLAQLLNWNFIDTDNEIEERTNMTINDIFQIHGESRFRSEERLVVQSVSQQENVVIATGGGTIINPLNWEDLNRDGFVIELYAALEDIIVRVGSNRDRPLLKGSEEGIKKLWSERQKYYGQAQYKIDTTGKNVDQVVAEIQHLLGG